MKGTAMNEAPREQSPGTEAVKEEIRDEHGDAATAPAATAQEEEQLSPEEFEEDPARNPDDGALKNIKGA
jgi:hypothetical protein